MPFTDFIEESLVGAIGNLTWVALGIIIMILIGFMILRINLKFSLLIVAPLLVVFSTSGWIPSWVGGITWGLVIGFSLFQVWNYIKER